MSQWRYYGKNYKALTEEALADAIYESDRGNIRGATKAKADAFISQAQSAYANAAVDASTQNMANRASESLRTVDSGYDATRDKKYKGSKMPVQLIVTKGAYWAVRNLEFGKGRRIPEFAVLRRTTYQMGGMIGWGGKKT
jgi:hypothetical protein